MKGQQNSLNHISLLKYVDVDIKSFWKLTSYSPCTQKMLLKCGIADLHFPVPLLNFLIFLYAVKQQYKEIK